jgi:ABC-type transport system involved in multi-copper enzyme maturation permease subunit
MSKAITEEPQDRTEALHSHLPAELAPSIIREEEPQLARTIGLCSVVLALVGADLLCWSVFQVSIIRWLFRGWLNLRNVAVPTGGPPLGFLGSALASVFFVCGLAGMLFHASMEKELQLRRLYGLLGALWLVLGVVLLGCHFAHVSWAANTFLPGAGAIFLALLFVLAFLRHEAEAEWHDLALNLVGGLGAALALVAFIGGNISSNFLLPGGLVLGLLGLGYIWAYVGARGSVDERSRLLGMGVGILGGAAIIVALVRAYILSRIFSALPPAGAYMVPTGVLLAGLGLLYVFLYVLIWVEVPVIIMARRELSGFFYSPIAYLVLLAFTLDGWLCYSWFVRNAILEPPQQQARLFEPVVLYFFFGLLPVVAVLLIIPILTMRALSEEKRTGTLEVLLTIPVDEWSVVLSKFLGTLIFFLLLWVPWLVFLLTIRVEGNEPFQLTPLLSFLVALTCMGANFVAMGLFFSSITRNQIISAVLTFAGMFALLFIYMGLTQLKDASPTSPWVGVLTHMSFIDLWHDSLEGKLEPQYLIFHVSAAFFWLFVTVKVIEARKWS